MPVRLMIGGVDHRHPAGFQAIAQREPWVVQITGGDLNGAKIEGTFAKIVVAIVASSWPSVTGKYM